MTMIKKSSFLIILSVFAFSLHAQTKKQYLNSADEAWERKDYYSALNYYKVVADAWPEELDVQWKTAESARLYYSYILAEKYYQIVIDNDKDIKYNEAYYHLAEIKRNLTKYSEAIVLYERYDQIRPDKEKNSQTEISYCRYALQAGKYTIPIELKPIPLNTEYSEVAPLIIKDTLYYSSMNVVVPLEDLKSQGVISRIYQSTNDAISNLFRFANVDSTQHLGHISFTPDLSVVYYTVCKNNNFAEINCQIFQAERSGSGWTNHNRLPDAINTPGYTASQPAFAILPNGKRGLFFVSNRTGGKGKLDIWFAQMNGNQQWETPENVTSINTAENDITPFFHHASSRLFFSSEGYPNLGGFDIFESTFKDAGWSAPANLPQPINSSFNDYYFVISEDGGKMYLASNRDSPGTLYVSPDLQSCCNDIFKSTYLKPINFIASAFHAIDKSALPGTRITLQVKSSDGWDMVDQKMDPNKHEQPFLLSFGNAYRIIGEKEGYTSDTLAFDTFKWELEDTIRKSLFLKPSALILDVFTFDAYTRNPLYPAKVQIYDMSNPAKPKLVDEGINLTNNNFTFSIQPFRNYQIRGISDGYIDTLANIDTYTIPPSGRISQNLYLRLMRPDEYTPIIVYFDNDIPGKRQRTRTTTQTYGETYIPYSEREKEYIDIFLGEMTYNEQFLVRDNIRDFFEDHVRAGYAKLNAFCESLMRTAEQGYTMTITIEGYTSPRAESYYNEKLSSRRNSSVENHITNFKDGTLKKYIESGQIKFKSIPYGETLVPPGVVDDLDDIRMSIYATEAAQERRSAITKVTMNKQ